MIDEKLKKIIEDAGYDANSIKDEIIKENDLELLAKKEEEEKNKIEQIAEKSDKIKELELEEKILDKKLELQKGGLSNPQIPVEVKDKEIRKFVVNNPRDKHIKKGVE